MQPCSTLESNYRYRTFSSLFIGTFNATPGSFRDVAVFLAFSSLFIGTFNATHLVAH